MKGIEYLNGKAFEYALADALNKYIQPKNGLIIDSAYDVAKQAYDSRLVKHQREFTIAAKVAVQHIASLEPNFLNASDIVIKIQDDKAGQHGDVRDVIITRHGTEWVIGLSAKNHHKAVKHSRLSDTIDFGTKWVGVPCSVHYMDAVREMFGRVRELKEKGVVYWRDVDNQKQILYCQLLIVFKDELCQLANKDPSVPTNLMLYLLGKHDFYKIIKHRGTVEIRAYNRTESLNKPYRGHKAPHKISKTKMPTKLIDVAIEGNNRLQAVFDGGWSVSFRIHNAESKITPSLKLDIQLVGEPSNLYNHTTKWSLRQTPSSDNYQSTF